jgi:lipopolysaccharide biosynthesis glycosyltransferase
LFFDSDILITGDLSQVMKLPDPFLACSDNHYDKLDEVRDRTTFERLPTNSAPNNLKPLTKTFNSGFMVVGKELLNKANYEGLKKLICFDVFGKITTHNTDQVALNLLFDQKVTYLPAAYNLILSQSPELVQKNILTHDEIKVVHFTGKYKPWVASEKMDELIVDPYYSAFINDWKDAYKEVKQKLDRNKQSL